MPLHVSSTCAHHQEVKIALHSLWYHHTYRCDDILEQKFCASIWLNTDINIPRCTVRKTSKMKSDFMSNTEMSRENKEGNNKLYRIMKLSDMSVLVSIKTGLGTEVS